MLESLGVVGTIVVGIIGLGFLLAIYSMFIYPFTPAAKEKEKQEQAENERIRIEQEKKSKEIKEKREAEIQSFIIEFGEDIVAKAQKRELSLGMHQKLVRYFWGKADDVQNEIVDATGTKKDWVYFEKDRLDKIILNANGTPKIKYIITFNNEVISKVERP